MLTSKFVSRSFTAALALGLIACGGAKEGGEAASGDTGGMAAAAETPAPAQQAGLNGETEYTNTCSVCHQPTGEGMPGAFPPLAGSDIVNMASPDRMIAIVLKGLQGPVTVKGQEFNSVMAPWESLSDEQIAAIVTHERSSWGNSASAVTPDMVAAVRTKVADRTTQWTIGEVEKAVP